MWGATVVAVGMIAYCAAVRPEVHADEASDRTDTTAALDRNLRDIADAIAELPRASSDAPVSRSVSIADEVARNVDRLRTIKGDDSAASRIVDYYPGYLEHFRKTAVALSKLKGREHSPLAAKTSCEGFQRDLQSQVQPFADKNDPDGLVRIPELVASFSSKADSTWRPVDSEKRDVDAYKSDALYYSDTDGRWNDVHNSVVRATNELYSAWLADFDVASKACAEVTAGMKAPFIETAMKSLGTSAASRTQIIKDIEDRLDAAATYLYGSERDSDDSRIGSATKKVDEIQSFLSALSYAKGKDQRANHIVDEWPRNIVAFYAAASQLRRLKQWQFTLDTAPTKCAETDRALQDFLDKQADPTSIPAIQAEAARLKADTEARFQSVSAKDREMESWNREVKNLQVDDGKWAPVSRNARDSADAMLA